MADDPQDWAHRLTTNIEQFTELLRDRSVRPLTRAIRIGTAGVIAVLLGILAAIVGVIGLVRVLDHDVFGGRAWATDSLVGGIFACLGVFFIRRGTRTMDNG